MSGDASLLVRTLNFAAAPPVFRAAREAPLRPSSFVPTYAALRIAHGMDGVPEPVDGEIVPHIGEDAIEALAAEALAATQAEPGTVPEILVDCREWPVVDCPAPTYRLALRLGLTDVLPFQVTAPLGVEPVAGLLLLADLLQGEAEALMVVSQALPPGEARRRGRRLVADGVAVLRLRRGGRGLKLSAAALGQACPAAVLDAALGAADCRRVDLRWAAPAGETPNAKWNLPRECEISLHRHAQEFSFGVVDPFAAWGGAGRRQGTGALLFAGPHGAAGAVIVTEEDKP